MRLTHCPRHVPVALAFTSMAPAFTSAAPGSVLHVPQFPFGAVSQILGELGIYAGFPNGRIADPDHDAGLL